jgi:predicted deacetylase
MYDEEPKRKFAIMIADAIQQMLRNSDELTEILEEAQEEGYDVVLSIFSGIMIRRRDQADEDGEADEQELPETFQFSDADKEFLQSIGIQVPDD